MLNVTGITSRTNWTLDLGLVCPLSSANPVFDYRTPATGNLGLASLLIFFGGCYYLD